MVAIKLLPVLLFSLISILPASISLAQSQPAKNTNPQQFSGIDYLGRDGTVKKYSKPLPYRQYDIIETDPNSKASIRFNDPDSQLLNQKTKLPDEAERLSRWLASWDGLNQDQALAAQYLGSYAKSKKEEYLNLAVNLQRRVISDWQKLQAASWPNTDFSYKAYVQKVNACSLLDSWADRAYFDGIEVAAADKTICSTFP